MQAGNVFYRTRRDLPSQVPILALPSLVLLPNGFISITIETKHNFALVDDVMRSDRLLGLVQPWQQDFESHLSHPVRLYDIGCLGRITSYSEIGDGKVLISLHGVCRFRLLHEVSSTKAYRTFSILPFEDDLIEEEGNGDIDRDTFLSVFQNYLAINDMQADWETILEATDEILVNALAVIAPFGSAEKQALLEAPDLKTRSETLIAIAERSILSEGSGEACFLH